MSVDRDLNSEKSLILTRLGSLWEKSLMRMEWSSIGIFTCMFANSKIDTKREREGLISHFLMTLFTVNNVNSVNNVNNVNVINSVNSVNVSMSMSSTVSIVSIVSCQTCKSSATS